MHEDIIKLANAADCNSYEALREQYPLPPAQLDGRVYTDPTLYAAERKRIFLESWFPACPQSDIPNPGDYTTWERLDQSVIIIRQEDGTISAWHNVCLHRGAKLVTGSGCAKGGLITCPWHGFSYSTAGELRVNQDTACRHLRFERYSKSSLPGRAHGKLGGLLLADIFR
jgi:phenylpropionate dioxygenase-like ring-hydroxylating dioxygenase large terminal subunit